MQRPRSWTVSGILASSFNSDVTPETDQQSVVRTPQRARNADRNIRYSFLSHAALSAFYARRALTTSFCPSVCPSRCIVLIWMHIIVKLFPPSGGAIAPFLRPTAVTKFSGRRWEKFAIFDRNRHLTRKRYTR